MSSQATPRGRPLGAPRDSGLVATALADEGFVDVHVTVFDHEGGVATARRPLRY